jgi:hypothetical protein
MLATNSVIDAAVENATKATKNLTHAKDGRHFLKVRCVFDRLIRHGKEEAGKLSHLQAFRESFSKSNTRNHVPASCEDHHAVQRSNTNPRKHGFLKGMVLLRRSHTTKVAQMMLSIVVPNVLVQQRR